MRRGCALFATGLVWALLGASNASASFHLMKVNEVSAGGADASYVELKMVADGQSQVSGHSITVHGADGSVQRTFAMTSNVASGQNQRTILIADTAGPSNADFVWSGLDLGQELTAGAVCFGDGSPPDCISWGLGFSGASALPGPPTTPFAGDIPISNALTRDTGRGCNTLLDEPDDTNSGSDYTVAAKSPQPNATAAEGSACPDTQILKKPKPKTPDRTPKFEFAGGDSYTCVLDGEETPCGQNFAPGRLSRGKHRLQVASAEDDGSVDGTPATYAWKIVKRK